MPENNPKKKTAKTLVQSGAEPEKVSAKKKTEKPKAVKGKTFKENIITDSETAKERGRNGGVKSGEVRRAKRDARETIQYMLERMTKSKNVRDNLKELGFEETEYSNMAALHGRLFTMAMSGNIEAYMTLMKMGGYDPEENRRERESESADKRRQIELDAKVDALGQKGADASMALSFNDEDDNSDVVIYMPQIASEESREEIDKNAETPKEVEDIPSDEE